MQRFASSILVTVILASLGADTVLADDEEIPGWYLDAELALVATSGNSESSTLGLGAKLRRLWSRSEFTLSGGATQTESSTITWTATGPSTNYTVQENKVTNKTAELYFLRGWYKYNFTPKFFGYSGVDWMSNRPAGIDSRTLVAVGAGNDWKNTDALKFKTFYSVTYTFQEDVVENPFVKTDFPGLRLGYDLKARLSTTTDFESSLVADLNLDNSDDVRLDWYNALPVGISETLLLKPAVHMLWRNQPALTNVLREGTEDIVTTTPLAKLDTIFTLALVVKMGPKAE